MDFKKLLGANINTQLAIHDKKQKDLAAFLGVKDNTISYFCKGSRAPSYEQLVKIADFFDVSIEHLLGRGERVMSESDIISGAMQYTGLSEKAIHNLRELDRYTRAARDHLEKVEGEIDAPDAFDAIDDLLSCEEGHAFLSQLASVSHFVTLANMALTVSKSMGFEERHECLTDAAQSLKVEMYYLSEAVRRLSQDLYKADTVLKRIDAVLVSDIISYCEKKESEADDGERS